MTGLKKDGKRIADPGILARLDARPVGAVALVPRQAYVAGARQRSFEVLDRFLPLTLPLSIGMVEASETRRRAALPHVRGRRW